MASNQPTFTGFEPEMQDISRQRDLAKLLLQKGMADNMQGQMVSGRYVGASPLQGIANIYSAYQGKKLAEESDRKQAELAEKLRQVQATEAQDILGALKGTPEQTIYGAGMEGPTMEVKPAVEGSQQAALARALAGRSPFSQTMATKLMERQFKEPKWERAKEYDPKTGNTNVITYDANSPNPESTKRVIAIESPAMSQKDILELRDKGINVGGVVSTGMPAGVSTGTPSGATQAPAGSVQTVASQALGLSPAGNRELALDKAKRQAKFAEEAPAALEMMNQTLTNIDDLIGDTKVVNGKVVYGARKPHEGFESAVGFSAAPAAKYFSGTSVSDFNRRFDQIKDKTFLQAFETLKGSGQITEIEGAKATSALNRMSLAQSEKEFIVAAREFEQNIKKGMELARQRAGMTQPTGGWRVK